MNRDNPKEYLSHDGWRTFAEWKETFRIRSGDRILEETRVLKETHVGPVLAIRDGYAFSARIIRFDSPALFEQAYLRTKAGSVKEYFEIMRTPGLSMWNHTVADSEGNID